MSGVRSQKRRAGRETQSYARAAMSGGRAKSFAGGGASGGNATERVLCCGGNTVIETKLITLANFPNRDVRPGITSGLPGFRPECIVTEPVTGDPNLHVAVARLSELAQNRSVPF